MSLPFDAQIQEIAALLHAEACRRLVVRVEQVLDAAAIGAASDARDAIEATLGDLRARLEISTNTVKFHLSNIFAREPFRHRSHISKAAKGVICGFGGLGYELAIEAIDWNVIFLLAAMMTVVSIMIPTGGFDWLAYRLAALAKGRQYLLLVLIGSAVTAFSLLLDFEDGAPCVSDGDCVEKRCIGGRCVDDDKVPALAPSPAPHEGEGA